MTASTAGPSRPGRRPPRRADRVLPVRLAAIVVALSVLTGCTMIWKPIEEAAKKVLGLVFDDTKLPDNVRAWAPYIVKAGSICPEAPPEVIAAQLYQESTFGENTNREFWGKRKDLAFGPAQFLIGTWSTHGADGDGDHVKDLWNPADAIQAMGEYDCYLVDFVRKITNKYTPQELMLASYNAGLGNVQKYKGIPPFPETQKYVRDILANQAKYAKPGSTVVGDRAQRVIAVAMEFVKKRVPYKWGGETFQGVDCSGLMLFAFRSVGVELERTAQQQIDQFKPTITLPQVQPGDMVGFDLSGSGGGSIKNITHIGLVSSVTYNDSTQKYEIQMIQAPKPGDVVKVSSVTSGYYGKYTPYFVRVPGSSESVHISPGKWGPPVPGLYSPTYKTPGKNWKNKHTGIDFPVGTNTPIKAVGPGTVVKSGWEGAFGYQVVIKHDDGKYTQYAHMSADPKLKLQSRVSGGQVIGRSGSTGNTTGPHLHFEARLGPDYGSDIDPVAYLKSKGVIVKPTVVST